MKTSSINVFRNFYDWLLETAESCIEDVDYSVFGGKKNLFIVSVIEEARVLKFVDGLEPSVNLTILVQDYVRKEFEKSFAHRAQIMEWSGGYTESILENMDLSEIDGFVFFSDFALNLRDQNFVEISEKIGVDTFCVTIGNDIYKYKNIPLYWKILNTYKSVSALIDEAFSGGKI